MEQIKVAYIDNYKRTTLPEDYQLFTQILRNLFNLNDKTFSIYHYENEKIIPIVDIYYQQFKQVVKSSNKTLTVYISTENHLSPKLKQLGFPDVLLNSIQNTIDSGVSTFQDYYKASNVTDFVDEMKTMGTTIVDNLGEKLNEVLRFIPKEVKYTKELYLIRTNYKIDRTDKQILQSLTNNEGDIDKSLSDLYL